MADAKKQDISQDDINAFLLNELETVNAILDLLLTHTQVPEKEVALTRLRVQMRQLDRQREIAAKCADIEALTPLDAERSDVGAKIRLLEMKGA